MSAIIVIGTMLFLGAKVNKKKLTHEFFLEKISEEKQRQTEEKARAAQKAANEAKRSNHWLGCEHKYKIWILQDNL